MLAMNMSVDTWWDKMTAKTSTLYLQQHVGVHDKEGEKNGSSSLILPIPGVQIP